MNNECTNDRFLRISVHKYQQSVFDDLLIQFPQSQGIKTTWMGIGPHSKAESF